MMEQEWLAAEGPAGMPGCLCFRLKLSRTKIGRRKLRLTACACCRRIWDSLKDERSRQAIELAEQFAEGLATTKQLDAMWKQVRERVPCGVVCAPISVAVQRATTESASTVAWMAEAQTKGAYHAALNAENSRQANLFRDIFGNPFRPVNFAPEWRTSTSVLLAQQMYESRDFSPMPILADALQDADCDNTDILNHCRDTSATHVRGCWVVDLVLGKS